MLKHVSFITADAGAVLRFYADLGASVRKDLTTAEGWRRLVLEFAGGGSLQFFERPGVAAPVRPDLGAEGWMEHVAVFVPDLAAAVSRLKAAGVTFTRELGPGPGGTPLAFVLDPDGRAVELLQGA